jgi:hypothetical protein
VRKAASNKSLHVRFIPTVRPVERFILKKGLDGTFGIPVSDLDQLVNLQFTTPFLEVGNVVKCFKFG